jgi:hypothetical protein
MVKKHGGKRKGAGRKSKSDEQALVEKLSPLSEKVFKALDNAIQEENSWALRLWFEYMYGKPRERVEVTKVTEQPLFGND